MMLLVILRMLSAMTKNQNLKARGLPAPLGDTNLVTHLWYVRAVMLQRGGQDVEDRLWLSCVSVRLVDRERS